VRRAPIGPNAAKKQGSASDKPEPLSPIVAFEDHTARALRPTFRTQRAVRHRSPRRLHLAAPRLQQTQLSDRIYDGAESRRSPKLADHGIRHFAGPQRNVIAHFAPVGIAFIRRSKRVFGNSYRLDVTILPEKVEHNDPFHSRSPHARLDVCLNVCLNCYFGCRPRTCVAKKACARTKASALAATLGFTLCRRGPGSSKSWVAPG
jgi:hypothetical protein